jgi:hypothetical protein
MDNEVLTQLNQRSTRFSEYLLRNLRINSTLRLRMIRIPAEMIGIRSRLHSARGAKDVSVLVDIGICYRSVSFISIRRLRA